MTEIKYQVFISSTYIDLIQERNIVLETLLKLGQIPAGMELFSADDDDSWKVIKDTIDNCDIYLLIVSKRYGSLTKKGRRIISFTRKEFEYALESKNKMPVLIFYRDDNARVDASLIDTQNTDKLIDFIKFIKESNKNHDKWSSANDLGRKVSVALSKTINKLNATPANLRGWVKRSSLDKGGGGVDGSSLFSGNSDLIFQHLEQNCLRAIVDNTEDVIHVFDNHGNCTIERIREQYCKSDVSCSMIEYESDKDANSEILEIREINSSRPTKIIPHLSWKVNGNIYKFFILYPEIVTQGNTFKYRIKMRVGNFLSNLLDNEKAIILYSSFPNSSFNRKDTFVFPNNDIYKNLKVKLVNVYDGDNKNQTIKPKITAKDKTYKIDYGTINSNFNIQIEFRLN